MIVLLHSFTEFSKMFVLDKTTIKSFMFIPINLWFLYCIHTPYVNAKKHSRIPQNKKILNEIKTMSMDLCIYHVCIHIYYTDTTVKHVTNPGSQDQF